MMHLVFLLATLTAVYMFMLGSTAWQDGVTGLLLAIWVRAGFSLMLQ